VVRCAWWHTHARREGNAHAERTAAVGKQRAAELITANDWVSWPTKSEALCYTICFGYRPALIMTPLAVGSTSARCSTTLLPMTHQGFRETQRRIATVDSSGRLILSNLNLNDEDLRTLQRTLGALTSLTMLYLIGNQLSTLPDSFGALTSLTVLDLNANQLSTLPDSFGALTSLTVLYLIGNQLSTLPDSFGALTSLTVLDLNANQLSTLPDSFGALTSLTVLDLNANQLSTLPESLGALTSLTYLYLNANQVSTLPEGLARLALLKTLSNATDDPLQPEVVATTPYD
jgi:hypothetical protein